MTIQISYNPLVWSEGMTTSGGQELTREQFDLVKETSKQSILSVIRNHRNKLLQECDWTQISDTGLSEEQKTAWSVYRQQLRDFPETLNMDEPFTLSEQGFPQKPQGN